MGSFQELPFLEQVGRRGASLLALLTDQFGPLPLGLAEARAEPRPHKRAHNASDGLPDDVVSTLLMHKGTTELMGLAGAGALSLGLRLLREAYAMAPSRWLCVLDEAGTLCAPAVAATGVPLSRMLVLRPERAEVTRLAVRVTRSGVFSAVLIDATRFNDLSELVVGVRRLSLAAEDAGASVLLLTSVKARRPQPLPVAARALIERSPAGVTLARVLRHRYGRLGTCVVPPLPTVLEPKYSELCAPCPSATAGKSQRLPAQTQARGHRARTRAQPALL